MRSATGTSRTAICTSVRARQLARCPSGSVHTARQRSPRSAGEYTMMLRSRSPHARGPPPTPPLRCVGVCTHRVSSTRDALSGLVGHRSVHTPRAWLGRFLAESLAIFQDRFLFPAACPRREPDRRREAGAAGESVGGAAAKAEQLAYVIDFEELNHAVGSPRPLRLRNRRMLSARPIALSPRVSPDSVSDDPDPTVSTWAAACAGFPGNGLACSAGDMALSGMLTLRSWLGCGRSRSAGDESASGRSIRKR